MERAHFMEQGHFAEVKFWVILILPAPIAGKVNVAFTKWVGMVNRIAPSVNLNDPLTISIKVNAVKVNAVKVNGPPRSVNPNEYG